MKGSVSPTSKHLTIKTTDGINDSITGTTIGLEQKKLRAEGYASSFSLHENHHQPQSPRIRKSLVIFKLMIQVTLPLEVIPSPSRITQVHPGTAVNWSTIFIVLRSSLLEPIRNGTHLPGLGPPKHAAS